MMKRIVHLLKQFNLMLSAFKPALRLYAYVAGGIAIGMLVAYILVPTQFRSNAVPAQMGETYREQWIKDTANGYRYVTTYSLVASEEDRAELNRRAIGEVQSKLSDVGATVADIDALIQKSGDDQYLVDSLTEIRPIAQTVNAQAQEQKDSYKNPGFFSNVILPIVVYILVAIVGALVTIYLTLFNIPFAKQIKGLFRPQKVDPSFEAELKRREAVKDAAQQKSKFDTPPVVQFMSTYLGGDNFYDDSFAIELEDNTFLGECGSGIAETIGTGDPKKVAGTEVWLFDKNDISTVTHVLMSENAYNDESVRAKLAPRGDAVPVADGKITVLETQTLRAEVRVVSLEYGKDDALPPKSFFDRLTVEIAVWQKEDGASVSSTPAPMGAMSSTPPAPPPTPSFTPPPQQPAPQGPPPQMPPQMPPQGMPPQQRPPQGPPPQGMPPQQRPPQGPPPQGMPPQQRPPQGPPPQGMPPQQRPPQGPPPQGMPPQQRPPQGMPPQQRPPQGPPQQMPPQQRPPQQGGPFGDTGELDL